jgi:hypothetical protein
VQNDRIFKESDNSNTNEPTLWLVHTETYAPSHDVNTIVWNPVNQGTRDDGEAKIWYFAE